jgi:hypothetical protein
MSSRKSNPLYERMEDFDATLHTNLTSPPALVSEQFDNELREELEM